MGTEVEFAESVEWVKNKEVDFGRVELDVLHASVGIAEEAGELLGIAKKIAVYKKKFDGGHVMEEAGDVLHYLQMLCNSQGWTLEDLMKNNMDKLKKRYPNGFTYEDARKRKDKQHG
jgi:NTP pyrophosphatase (non-canonical NTP hydrolase)